MTEYRWEAEGTTHGMRMEMKCIRLLSMRTYVVENVWQKIEVETMNDVLVNGEKRT